jgi:hypothetical protein
MEANANERRGDVIKQTLSFVELRILENKSGKLTGLLENNTSTTIFVFYEPSEDPQKAKQIVFSFQRRLPRKSDFNRLNSTSHLALDLLNPIAPKTALSFQVDISGLEGGEYRLVIGYWDDEGIYKTYREKWPDLKDEELKRMAQSSKSAWSNSFVVSRNQREK